MDTQGGFLITRIKQVGGRVFEHILAEKNIDAFNGAQGRILYVLWRNDGVPISTLPRETSYGAFIDGAPEWNPRAEFITGKVCGIQVETIADPRMKKLRQLDKLVDELAKGWPMEKVTFASLDSPRPL